MFSSVNVLGFGIVGKAETYEQERIVLLERLWVGGGDASILWRSMHLAKDLLWECLCDLVDVGAATSFLNASGLSLGELLDVAPCGVLYHHEVSTGVLDADM